MDPSALATGSLPLALDAPMRAVSAFQPEQAHASALRVIVYAARDLARALAAERRLRAALGEDGIEVRAPGFDNPAIAAVLDGVIRAALAARGRSGCAGRSSGGAR